MNRLANSSLLWEHGDGPGRTPFGVWGPCAPSGSFRVGSGAPGPTWGWSSPRAHTPCSSERSEDPLWVRLLPALLMSVHPPGHSRVPEDAAQSPVVPSSPLGMPGPGAGACRREQGHSPGPRGPQDLGREEGMETSPDSGSGHLFQP